MFHSYIKIKFHKFLRLLLAFAILTASCAHGVISKPETPPKNSYSPNLSSETNVFPESLTSPQSPDSFESNTTTGFPSGSDYSNIYTTGPQPSDVNQLPPLIDEENYAPELNTSDSGNRGTALFNYPPQPPGVDSYQMEKMSELAQSDMEALFVSESPIIPGWNLLSIPEEPSNSDPAFVLDSLNDNYNRVFAYDGCDTADPWKLYDPADVGNSDLAAIDHKIGFWIEMNAPSTLVVTGTQPVDSTIQLCEGWNLIGYPLDQPLPVAGALSAIEGSYTHVFGYDATNPNEPWDALFIEAPAWSNDLPQFEPGHGYWISATETINLEFTQPGLPPAVEIVNPLDGDEVTSPTQITGIVTGSTTIHWEFQYRAVGDTDWIPVSDGDINISQPVGELDPTLLLNGIYEIRLIATDLFGQSAETTINVIVTGEMKVGAFSLSFVDMNIPVAGIPLTLIRTYDSRDKRIGDFGVGWKLEVLSGKYTNNRLPGDGWQMNRGGLFNLESCYSSEETKLHITEIRFSDYEYYQFALQVNMYGLGSSITGGCLGDVEFVQTGGLPGAELTILDDIEVYWKDETDFVTFAPFNPNFGKVYEPERVLLATADGRQFELTLNGGVQRIIDLNGNELLFTETGVVHSSGKELIMNRDSLGRITNIVDPLGNAIDYAYDSNGNLISVSDPAGYVTQFTYNSSHDLIDIIDPRGVNASKNEYDADGRLIAVTDADGNRIEFSHNIQGRQEVVRDRNGNVSLFEYDDFGNVIREIDALGNSTTYTYDSNGNVLSITDALGNVSSYTYDSNSNLLSETTPLGFVTSFSYNLRNQLVSLVDPNGYSTQYSFDDKENLVRITDAGGNVTTVEYDVFGYPTLITDALFNSTSLEYDNFGSLTQLTNPQGTVFTFTYDANGNQLSRTSSRLDGSGSVVTSTISYVYDENNRVIQVIDPEGYSTVTEYNAIGLVSAIIDKNGNRKEFFYDSTGNLIETSYPDGTSETNSYDPNGNLISNTDREGNTTQYHYDQVNRLVNTVFPDGSTKQTSHNAVGLITSYSDENGNEAYFNYDALGRNTTIVDALNNATSFTYDANSNLTSRTDAKGNTTFYSYDELDRLVRTDFPDGTKTESTFDSLGRMVLETDQAGNLTQYTYDEVGNLIRVTDALGYHTSYGYDEWGNNTSQTDANGNTTTWTYDNLGRVTSRILPLGMEESFSYYPNGGLSAYTDFNGQTTTFIRDSNGRLLSKIFPDNTEISYSFTPAGLIHTVTDSRGVTTYSYDDRYQLVNVMNPDGAEISYTYDLAGNRTSVSIPSGTTTYTYDSLNRLQTVTDPLGGETTYGYDSVGNRATVSYPNGTATNYSYDSLNQLIYLKNINPTGGAISSYAYTLDETGHRIGIYENSGRSFEYTYDSTYRLLSETINDPIIGVQTTSYTYDPVGNRVLKVDESGQTIYTYDANNRILNAGALSFTYDNNGNTLSSYDGISYTYYSYDYENQLIGVQTPDNNHFYNYDSNGFRVSSTVNGITINYLVDNNTTYAQVLEERDSDNNLLVSYVYGDDLISQNWNGLNSYHHYDGLGSTRALTDQDGELVSTYSYSAFGAVIDRTGSSPNKYLFTGEQYDSGTDLYYLRARYYSATFGRFMSMDSFLGDPQSPVTLHKYLYANANPINYIDPSGYFSISGLMSSIGVQSILVNIAIGSTFGAVTGAADAFFGDRDVLEGALTGAVVGGAFGAAGSIGAQIPALAIRIKIIKPILASIGVVASFVGIYDALQDEDYDLAAFRAVTSIAGFAILGGINKISQGSQLKVSGRLQSAGVKTWISSAGLRYGPDPRYGNRVLHVLNHATNDPARNLPHGVFTVGRSKVIALLDEAYLMVQANPSKYYNPVDRSYHIPMGRIIGYEGGAGTGNSTQMLKLVLNGIDVITAYPFIP